MTKPLRVWRTERLSSVRDLAGTAGVSTKTVVQLEFGRQRPNYTTMRRLSEALQVDPREITEFAAALEDRGKTRSRVT
jgi:transcriptional regulator with XRE-family HTH domain